jgi:hypothetical protein
LELLTILYALLAAVTGIGGGERVVLVDRAAMAAPASAGCPAEIATVRAVQAQRAAHRPFSAAHIVTLLPEARAALRIAVPSLFDLASFANRRE